MSKYIDKAIDATVRLVKIPSVEAPRSAPNAPFGDEVRNALDEMFAIARENGFAPVDVDGYAGYVDWNVGAPETLGVLSHLDVVPLDGGWTHAHGEVADGCIWGRGTTDDKGPTVACLFALKELVDEGFVPQRNIRLIWGCNEETGSKCMEYYTAHVGMPEIGFSPDGDFPLISCEKTILHLECDVPVPSIVKSWHAGTRANVVPALSTLTLSRKLDSDEFECEQTEEGFVYTARGVAAHAMNPALGDNAIWKNAALLRSLGDSGIKSFDNLLTLMTPYALEILGIDCYDEQSGSQTINIGVIHAEEGVAHVTFDLRCPVVQDVNKVVGALEEYLGTKIEVCYHAPHLFADRNSELYKKLYASFTQFYGKEIPPVISGGGTYARRMPCGVAFGPYVEGVDNHIHDRDEFIEIKHLDFLIDVYKDAIRRLATLD